MRFKVPKDVDIEDRIVGPLTLKQMGWLGGGMLICIVFWKTMDFSLFVFFSLLVMGLSAAFAFVRPYNQSLIAFCGSVMLFITKPKLYFWGRKGVFFPRGGKSHKSSNLIPLVKKGFSEKEIEKLADTLDKTNA
ncbi:MAG: PrgI family protein [Candidatus Moranbacteria bacterium]|nr:PrgI family protein [Candidatus Moranbacteria bacterium]